MGNSRTGLKKLFEEAYRIIFVEVLRVVEGDSVEKERSTSYSPDSGGERSRAECTGIVPEELRSMQDELGSKSRDQP